MTFKEILERVEFIDLVKPLIERDKKASLNLYSYKEAFDLLRMMQPQDDDGITVDVDMTDYDDGKPPCLAAHFKLRTEWESIIAREVVIADDCQHLPIADIAAILLWEITYWGFDPDNQYIGEARSELTGIPLAKKLAELKQKHHDHNCRYKQDIGTPYYTLKDKSDLNWEPRRNGPKRHREKRQQKRIEVLERMVGRWHLTKILSCRHNFDTDTFQNLFSEIMQGPTFSHYCTQSRTPDGNDGEYLAELIRDYFPEKSGSKSIVMIRGMKENLSENADMIKAAFDSLHKLPNPQYIVSQKDEMTNIYIDILVFE